MFISAILDTRISTSSMDGVIENRLKIIHLVLKQDFNVPDQPQAQTFKVSPNSNHLPLHHSSKILHQFNRVKYKL